MSHKRSRSAEQWISQAVASTSLDDLSEQANALLLLDATSVQRKFGMHQVYSVGKLTVDASGGLVESPRDILFKSAEQARQAIESRAVEAALANSEPDTELDWASALMVGSIDNLDHATLVRHVKRLRVLAVSRAMQADESVRSIQRWHKEYKHLEFDYEEHCREIVRLDRELQQCQAALAKPPAEHPSAWELLRLEGDNETLIAKYKEGLVRCRGDDKLVARLQAECDAWFNERQALSAWKISMRAEEQKRAKVLVSAPAVAAMAQQTLALACGQAWKDGYFTHKQSTKVTRMSHDEGFTRGYKLATQHVRSQAKKEADEHRLAGFLEFANLLAKDSETVLREELPKHGRKLAEMLRPYDINKPPPPFERVADVNSPFCVAQRSKSLPKNRPIHAYFDAFAQTMQQLG